MKELPPYIAAKAALEVYALTKYRTLKAANEYLNNEYGGVFALPFSNDNLLKGKTGGPGFIKTRTAFGFVLIGQGYLEGHAFILFRGTQYIADWITNLNATTSNSAIGESVHDGFNKAFKSMEPQLIDFMGRLQAFNIHTIDCIGHSLGGALATICAEWIKKNYKHTPKIYTFGSPRVGLYSFASLCTSQIRSHNIYRAYHSMDIVPSIPVWPFYHVPLTGKDCRLTSPGGMMSFKLNHDMKKYVKSVHNKTWSQLKGMPVDLKDEKAIENWLQEESALSINLFSIEWLNQAIIYVLRKCFDGASWLLSKTFSTTYTLMDQLAFILKKGIDLAGSISGWVIRLMKKIMLMLGMKALVEGVEFTAQFIRYVLQSLSERVNRYVKDVLSDALVAGRAI